MTGFVSFVGSGPGDPELLTLKALDRLKSADAVLYDDLAAGPILSHARPGADLVSVGKRAGRPSPKQNRPEFAWTSDLQSHWGPRRTSSQNRNRQ